MIIDSFLFYNELNMLKYRLSYLYEYVDYFILVESKYTFSGNEKKNYYEENKEMFSEFNDKIIHIKLDENNKPKLWGGRTWPKRNNIWLNEHGERNSISKGISKINRQYGINDDDLIMLSDVDEIPNMDNIHLIDKSKLNNMASLFYQYNLFNINKSKKFESGCKDKRCTRIFTYKFYKNSKAEFQDIRSSYGNVIDYGGWHLSDFGDSDFIINKYSQYSHSQDSDVIDLLNNDKRYEIIENKIFDKNSHTYTPIENNNFLPPNYKFLFELFPETHHYKN
jgi:beta-1,4-mannosyl-glycoprotein beta-1,4-N-acetylglucosaminyltransferase